MITVKLKENKSIIVAKSNDPKKTMYGILDFNIPAELYLVERGRFHAYKHFGGILEAMTPLAGCEECFFTFADLHKWLIAKHPTEEIIWDLNIQSRVYEGHRESNPNSGYDTKRISYNVKGQGKKKTGSNSRGRKKDIHDLGS